MNAELNLMVREYVEGYTSTVKKLPRKENRKVTFDEEKNILSVFPTHHHANSDEIEEEPSNDDCNELFFDDKEDDDNSKWVADNLPGGKSKNTDAVLNCAGCMSVLSLDSKRHNYFKTKYASDLPINCRIDESKVLPGRQIRVAKKKQKSKITKQSVLDVPTSITAPDVQNPMGYYAVHCAICGINIGLKDIETGTIHFENVISSHC